jgi:tetratricopeptide (TPR) repeat protein
LSILKQLVDDFPSQADSRQELARSHNNRGNHFSATKRLPEAEKDFDQALGIYQQLAVDFPTRPEFREELAMGYINRGGLVLTPAGRFSEAEKDIDQALSIQKQLAADFPSRPEFRRQLAGGHGSRGILLNATNRPKEAEKEYDQDLSIMKQLAADFPNQPDLQNELAGTCVNFAVLQKNQGDWGAAKRLLLEGLPHHLAALKASPRHPIYRQFYRNNLNVLTKVYAGLLEQEDAVRTAETSRDLGWNAAEDAYEAAWFLSRCIPIVANHDKLDEKQRNEAAQFYSEAAMKLLREAVSKGYTGLAHMKEETDLDPLRQREDFQKLVAELEGSAK